MQRLEQYDTFALPLASIYYDPDFNCRAAFMLESVRELAESIGKHGLTYPVIVQPWTEREGYAYRLLAGHRRYRATQAFLKWETIPATMRKGLSDWDARKLNFTENLERKDLNVLEEARAIQRLFPDGATIDQVKNELQRSYYWSYIRLRLLKLPEEIQEWVGAGLLTKDDIEALDQDWESPEAQMKEAQRLVRRHREFKPGRKHGFKQTNRKRPKRLVPVRSRDDMNKMVARMLEAGVIGLAPRAVAWCAGHVTDEDLIAEIEGRQAQDGGK